jgi:hypothetical protein
MGGSSSSQIKFPVPIGNHLPLVVIGGINVLESLELALEVGSAFRDACAELGLCCVFKASFDKANRSSGNSFRGPGLEQGLAWLAQVKQQGRLKVCPCRPWRACHHWVSSAGLTAPVDAVFRAAVARNRFRCSRSECTG